jgi:geranylgeranyl reductase family protein
MESRRRRRTVGAVWDVAVVGAGPAGAAAALGVLTADPGAQVVLLDRADFPRDKACGDGIAPHVLDVLGEVGVHGLLDDWTPVRRLVVRSRCSEIDKSMRRPAYVVPRAVFDARLTAAAVSAGAVLRRHRVRALCQGVTSVVLDDAVEAKVVIGADGAGSVVRSALGVPLPRLRALALRGYAPTLPERASRQEIVFGTGRQPAYAWSFDRGDGLSNVGYGELLTSSRPNPTRRHLLDQLERLLPGSVAAGGEWLGHHLPLSSWRWRHHDGRVLLAGDAAGLVNPTTGEGIFYAVATGVAAGRAAAAGLASGSPERCGATYRDAVGRLLRLHLASTAVASRLIAVPAVAGAALRAGQRNQRVFDDIVELGLGRGTLTPRLAGSVASAGLRR